MIRLGENRYGKSRVRLIRVKRRENSHELHEWTVQVLLTGDFASCFTDGDNSRILPTDTMKNTVYSLARKSSAGCLEEFAKELVVFFLERNAQLTQAQANISESPWDHIVGGGKYQPTAFIQSSRELKTTSVSSKRDGKM